MTNKQRAKYMRDYRRRKSPPLTIQERFDAKWTPEPNSGCWLWTGATLNSGYGTFRLNGQLVTAHRASFILNGGTPSVDICHSCDTRLCVNPAHLFAGTRLENIADSIRKGRFPRGERMGLSKLKDAQIVEIRASRQSQRFLARQYGVSQQAIQKIKTNQTWRHI